MLDGLGPIVEGDNDEDSISNAFELVGKMDELQPAPYNTRWLVKSAFAMHAAHWDTRPIGPAMSLQGHPAPM